MALNSTKTLGCSGCLIEAIELRNESTLRTLLSLHNVEFYDTYWAPLSSVSTFERPYLLRSGGFARLSTPTAVSSTERCTHSMAEQTLCMGQPSHIAMSVVLASMMYTTTEFNAFRILAESQKFDLSEPLIFQCEIYQFQLEPNWNVVVMDPAVMAMLLYTEIEFKHEAQQLLLETLISNSLLRMDMQLRISCFEWFDSYEHFWFWDSIYAKDVLSFLSGCYSRDSARLFFGGNYKWPTSRCNKRFVIFSLIKDLFDMDIIRFRADHRPVYFKRCHFPSDLVEGLNIGRTYIFRQTLLGALTKMFDIEYEWFIKFNYQMSLWIHQLIRNGWICAQEGEDDNLLYELVRDIHFQASPKDSLAAFRILRQLLALGFFRRMRFDSCIYCASYFLAERRYACTKLVPLREEFARKPLSLQQLSRLQVRSSIGTKDFVRRVQTLPLPFPLLKYVWIGNEMSFDYSYMCLLMS